MTWIIIGYQAAAFAFAFWYIKRWHGTSSAVLAASVLAVACLFYALSGSFGAKLPYRDATVWVGSVSASHANCRACKRWYAVYREQVCLVHAGAFAEQLGPQGR